MVSWEEATSSNKFVKLESDTAKTLVLTNWRLEESEKFGEKQIEFVAEVVEEDGKVLNNLPEPKLFTTTSKRLKTKLRAIFENKDPKTKLKLSVLKVGDKYDTQYSVKLL